MKIEFKEKKSVFKIIKFFMKEKGQEIAHVYLFIIFNQCGGYYYGLMEDAFVKEEYRKQGIGSNLVQELLHEARDRHLHHVVVTSRYSRPHIHKWYQKIGFKDYGKEFRIDF